jgi:hypothetical protein
MSPKQSGPGLGLISIVNGWPALRIAINIGQVAGAADAAEELGLTFFYGVHNSLS